MWSLNMIDCLYMVAKILLKKQQQFAKKGRTKIYFFVNSADYALVMMSTILFSDCTNLHHE